MKKALLAITALIGFLLAGAESTNFSTQVWLNVGGTCLFAVGMIKLAKTLNDGDEA